MVSLENIVVTHAGEASLVLTTITDIPPSRPGEMYHTVLLQVAHAHPHGMASQGKRATGPVNEASPARSLTILQGQYRASLRGSGRNNRRCQKGSLTWT